MVGLDAVLDLLFLKPRRPLCSSQAFSAPLNISFLNSFWKKFMAANRNTNSYVELVGISFVKSISGIAQFLRIENYDEW